MAKTSSQSQKISTTTSKAKNDDSNNKNKKKEATTKVKKRTRKSIPQASPTPRRSSIYRGVTRHRWTGRYEAHLWDKNCLNESSNKKGRQVYLGAYDDEEAAAHAYDLAALKYWGPDTPLNFPVSNYEKQLKEMEGRAREEYIGSLRRTSSGFSRGVSKYRGVARHHHNGRWEARIGRVFGNKYLYLGTYATQEEAAAAYDMAAIEYRGLNAVTNFDLSRYIKRLHPNNKTNLENNQPKPISNNEVNLLSNFPLHTTQLDNSTTSGSSSELSTTTTPNGASSSSSSALGLLLKSPKFKEMLERNTTNIVDSPLTSMTVDQPRRSFPDDIQTYFDCNNNDSSNYYVDGDHDIIFGGLNALDSSIFQCEL